MAQLVSYSHRHKYCIAWMAIMIAIHHQKRRLSIFCSKKDYPHFGCGTLLSSHRSFFVGRGEGLLHSRHASGRAAVCGNGLPGSFMSSTWLAQQIGDDRTCMEPHEIT